MKKFKLIVVLFIGISMMFVSGCGTQTKSDEKTSQNPPEENQKKAVSVQENNTSSKGKSFKYEGKFSIEKLVNTFSKKSPNGRILEIEYDNEKAKNEYEIKFLDGSILKSYKCDANTGNILRTYKDNKNIRDKSFIYGKDVMVVKKALQKIKSEIPSGYKLENWSLEYENDYDKFIYNFEFTNGSDDIDKEVTANI